ncbi:DNA methyltransferase 1-associated protein 1 [Entophlyctis luteolus]|nr:DNA methyltransferase 1-associated protein 1 [Entophlyctis luteolus]
MTMVSSEFRYIQPSWNTHLMSTHRFFSVSCHYASANVVDAYVTTDPDWTKDETDELFDLCRRFDLRFIVVADRLESGRERSVEDIKERYYNVTNKINASRAMATGVPIAQPAFVFNKEREVERKKNLAALYNRSPEQIKEEEYLFHELKRRELHETEWTAHRDYLVKILSKHELSTPMPLPPIPGIGSTDAKKRKRDQQGSDANQKKKAGVASTLAHDSIGLGLVILQIGSVILRISQLTRKKRRTARRVLTWPSPTCSQSLGNASAFQGSFGRVWLIPKTRKLLAAPPTMPNVAVCDVVDEVRLNVMVLIDTRRACEKIEAEIMQLRERKRALAAGELAASASFTGATKGAAILRGGDSDDGDDYDESDVARRRRKSSGSGFLKKARFH